MGLSKIHRSSNEKKSEPIAVTFDEAYNDSLKLGNPVEKSIMKLNAQILRAKDDSTISIPRELQPYHEDVNLPPVFETHVNLEADLLGKHTVKPPREHAFFGFRFTEYNPKKNSFDRKFIRIGFGTREEAKNNYSNIMNDTESNRVVSTYTQINYEQLKKGYNSIQPYFDKYPEYNYLSRNCNTFVQSIAGSMGLNSIVSMHSISASMAGDTILMSSMKPEEYPQTTFDVTPFSKKTDPILTKTNIKNSVQILNGNVKLKFLDDNFIEDIQEYSNIKNHDLTPYIDSIENLFEDFENNLPIENAMNKGHFNNNLSMYCKRIENALRQTSQIIGSEDIDAYIEMMRYAYIFSKYSNIFTMDIVDTCDVESLLNNKEINKNIKIDLVENMFSKSWGSDQLSKLAIMILSPNPPSDDISFHLIGSKRLNTKNLQKVFDDIYVCVDKNIEDLYGALDIIQKRKGFSDQELAQYLVKLSIHPFILDRYMKALGITDNDPLYRLFRGIKFERLQVIESINSSTKNLKSVDKIENTSVTPINTASQLMNGIKYENQAENTPATPTEPTNQLVDKGKKENQLIDISEYINKLIDKVHKKIQNRHANNNNNGPHPD